MKQLSDQWKASAKAEYRKSMGDLDDDDEDTSSTTTTTSNPKGQSRNGAEAGGEGELCTGCGLVLEGQAAHLGPNAKYHLQCFRCHTCKKRYVHHYHFILLIAVVVVVCPANSKSWSVW